MIAGIVAASSGSQTTSTGRASTTSTTTGSSSSRSHRFDVTVSTSETESTTRVTSTATVSNSVSETLAIQASRPRSAPPGPSQRFRTWRPRAFPTRARLTTSLPGQSLPESLRASTQHTSIDDKTEAGANDAATAIETKTPAPNESPIPGQQDATEPVDEQTPADSPAPGTGLPTDDLPPALPAEPEVISTLDDQNVVSLSALAGTASLVAGGCLVLGRSDRIGGSGRPSGIGETPSSLVPIEESG